MRKIFFENLAHGQFLEWEKQNKKLFAKIIELLDETRNTPFKGKGKPEPLKYQYQGYWSRRITHEHRLIYQVTEEAIIVISCKYHY